MADVKDAGRLVIDPLSDTEDAELLRDRLAAIVNWSEDAILGKTLEGIVTSWNAGAERLYGYTPEEIIGQPISVLVPDDRPDEIPSILARLARGEPIGHYETVRRRKDGVLLDISVSISPIRDSEGHVVGASAIARDIGEQKRLQRLQDEFLAVAAHELKTPLTAIKGFAQLLQRRGDQNPLLDRIAVQVDRMDRLVRELLQASRLEAGQFEVECRDVELVSLIERCIADVRSGGAQQEMHLHCPERSIIGTWDPDRVEQIVHNLLNNAVKYSPSTEAIDIYVSLDGVEASVSVVDRGVGLAAEDLPKLFERFYRVPRADRLPGLGLGLYLTRKYVEAHGGRISVESKGPGQGSTFHFVLPLGVPALVAGAA